MTSSALRRAALGFTFALALLPLAGCKTSEEKAEERFQAGQALLAAGEPEKALVEYRNVFQLDNRHREARRAYAALQRSRGEVKDAYGQYLRLVEQYPDDFEGNLALAEMAMPSGAWDEVALYGRRAAKIRPEDPTAQGIVVIADYREAFQAKDEARTADVLERGRTLLGAHPELSVLRQFLADETARSGDPQGALALVEKGIALDPDYGDFQTMRLALLYQLGQSDAITAQLREMVARDPADRKTQDMLIAWYVSRGDLDAAEAELRGRIDPATDDLDPRLQLVQFLIQTRDPETARKTLAAFIAEAPGSAHVPLYRSMQAGIDFEAGRREEAIAQMRAILEEAPTSADAGTIRIALAQMLSDTGNEVGARALVEEVLAADPASAPALKLKAGWLIEDDKTGEAQVALRSALEQNPRDAEAMTLMAQAHEREGNTDLMTDMLAQAVEASGQAPAQSLRYAAALRSQGKLLPAEDVLIAALRRQPEQMDLLTALGELYLEMKDWPRAETVVRTLEGGKTEGARHNAETLRARLLAASGQESQLRDYLEGLASQPGRSDARIGLVRDAIRRGEYDLALKEAAALEADSPQSAEIAYLHAMVLLSADRPQEAEPRLAALVAAHPEFEQGWLGLFNLQSAQGKTEAAAATIEKGLAAKPDGRLLQWAKAGMLERNGDYEGAIALYEELYALNSNWLVGANNLANLLIEHRSDPESVERAYVLARRLRGSQEPAFLDTYGWVSFRRGNLEEAVTSLETAAKGLPDDPMVQYHLAMAYGARGEVEKAKPILEAIRGKTPPAPAVVLEKVEAELARLAAAPPAPAAPQPAPEAPAAIPAPAPAAPAPAAPAQ